MAKHRRRVSRRLGYIYTLKGQAGSPALAAHKLAAKHWQPQKELGVMTTQKRRQTPESQLPTQCSVFRSPWTAEALPKPTRQGLVR